MPPPAPEPEKEPKASRLPHFCGHCSGSSTEDHCFNAYCTWVKCRDCHRLTDVRGLIGKEDA